MLRKAPLALACSLAWGMSPVLAADQPVSMPAVMPVTPPLTATPTLAAGPEASVKPSVDTLLAARFTRLNEITVSATRTARQTDAVPSTVTLISADQIEEAGVRDLKDLFRYELDVGVRSQAKRFTAAGSSTGRAGNEGINIRGLEGNQVLMMVDGIRVPNSFSFGGFASGRGDFLEVDGMKGVEVLRGPSSTQFGSDGLAGAVSFRTLDPADLLQSGRNGGGFVRSGYAEIDRSWSQTLGVAGRSGDWQGLILGSYRRGHEVMNQGDNDALNSTRTTPNPLDYRNRYLLGKLLFDVDNSHQLGLTLESQQRRQDTDVYSARALPPLGSTSVLGLDAQDEVDRDRVSLEHHFEDSHGAWVQKVESRIYWQEAMVSQVANEDRNTAADRVRAGSYNSRMTGFSTQLESRLGGSLPQRLSYGLDWSRSDLQGIRDGTVPPMGEIFPTRAFPDTTYTLAGAFVQSEIEAGAFSIIPSLRYDHYKLNPSAEGYAGGAPAGLSGSAVTPRLGVVWQVLPGFAPYAQYARGFRAPTPEQVNTGFSNLAFGYTSVGNPDLKAERADSLELGVRGKQGGLRYALAAYSNRYKDFISQEVVGGSGIPTDPTVFQYINLAKVHISGWEVRTDWRFDDRWSANAGLGYSRGHSEIGGIETPLDTIQPLKAVLGVRYDQEKWGARANLIHAKGKTQHRIAPADTPQFAPPSHTVVDVGLYWKPRRNLTVNANLNNAFDRKYWNWSDVRGLGADSAVKDGYTAPGRNAQISVRYDF